jgi:hypothetical protein
MFLHKPFERGSVFDVLSRFGGALIRRSDFPDADPLHGGKVGWCPVQLSGLVLLQRMHGWTDREAIRRATMDLQVKACLGMGIEEVGPSQPTLCRHRQTMQELGLEKAYAERLRQLLEALELVSADEPVLIDSVPIDGAGQQLDTYNLLAGATRNGLRALAKAKGRDVEELAKEMGLSAYLGRSVKGRFDVRWDDEASRLAFLTTLVDDALRVRRALNTAADVLPETMPRTGPETLASGEDAGGSSDLFEVSIAPVADPSKFAPEPAAPAEANADGDDVEAQEEDAPRETEMKDAIETIDKIIAHDIERSDDGAVKGISQKAAGDRQISLTDPDMRHGRKSASQLIAGFKAQVIATVAFGFIVMCRVIKANVHDGRDLPALIEELADKGIKPAWVGGDHAYGTLKNHAAFAGRPGTELIARMPRPVNGGRFTKDEFSYDFEKHTLTCPSGQTVADGRQQTRDGRRGREFDFTPSGCKTCPMRAKCVAPTAKPEQGRTLFIVDDDEHLIREHLKDREQPSFRERLAKRTRVEHVLAGFAQCGGKQARRFGIEHVSFDEDLSALAYNLRRLGGLMRRDEQLEARVARVARALLRALIQAALRWSRRLGARATTAAAA